MLSDKEMLRALENVEGKATTQLPRESKDEISFAEPKKDKYTNYVLRLEHGCYYSGRIASHSGKTVNDRFLEHVEGKKGSSWTQLHPPLEVIEIRPNCSPFDEDAITLEYMHKYGIDKVRGGSYCSVELSQAEFRHIQHQLQSATNKCYRCGGQGHLWKNCSKKSPRTLLEKSSRTPLEKSSRTLLEKSPTTLSEKSPEVDVKEMKANDAGFFIPLTKGECTVVRKAKEWMSYLFGGSFISSSQLKQKRQHKLKYRFAGRTNACWRCGDKNHVNATKCTAKIDINGIALI